MAKEEVEASREDKAAEKEAKKAVSDFLSRAGDALNSMAPEKALGAVEKCDSVLSHHAGPPVRKSADLVKEHQETVKAQKAREKTETKG